MASCVSASHFTTWSRSQYPNEGHLTKVVTMTISSEETQSAHYHCFRTRILRGSNYPAWHFGQTGHPISRIIKIATRTAPIPLDSTSTNFETPSKQPEQPSISTSTFTSILPISPLKGPIYIPFKQPK